MTGFITFVHISACVLLVIMILLQQAKGDGMGSAFGGAGSQSVLGSRGAATVLTKATTALAILFMVTSLTLAYFSSRSASDSLLKQATPSATQGMAPQETPTNATQEQDTQGDADAPVPAAEDAEQ